MPQDKPDAPADDSAGLPLIDFLGRMLRGFVTEIEPQLRDFAEGFEALEPEIQGFLERMRGMVHYHPPEMLPNGDILIRRRAPDEALPRNDNPHSFAEPFEL